MNFKLTFVMFSCLSVTSCRDEEKIAKACYWPNEMFEACFGGCAEVSCDNPRAHLRPCYPYCEPGCVCTPPYVRDDRTHACVLPQDCSPTQMGIPVPPKMDRRSDKSPPSLTPLKHFRQTPHIHQKQEDSELIEDTPSSFNYRDDYKRLDFSKIPDIPRMGNYFNIVIAPPPIKALQPRKLLNANMPRRKRLS